MKRTLALVAVLLALCTSLMAGSFTRGPDAPFGDSADFNHDGLDDLVDGNWEYGMRIWLNTGGAYTLAKTFPLASGEQFRGTLDVNGDGVPDLITAGSSSAPVSLMPGLASPFQYTLYLSGPGLSYTAAGTLPAVPIAADLDSDGKDDIILFLPNVDSVTRVLVSWTMTVGHSRGDGTFERRQTMTVTTTDPNRGLNRGFAVGDLNGDGHPDLVTGSMDDLMIFYGKADGTLREPVRRYLPLSLGALAGGGTLSNRTYDVDGDGNLDLVLFNADSVRVLFGDGRGGFPRYAVARVTGTPGSLPGWDTYLRNLGFGGFTTSSRTEIAAGAYDGSIVIYSAQGGTLREVSRTRTGLTHLRLTGTAFHVTGQRSDLLIGGDSLPSGGAPGWAQAIPRTYLGDPTGSGIVVNGTRSSRNRIAGFPQFNPPMNLTVTMKGDCAPGWSDSWHFVREGVFATDQNDARNVEAAIDGEDIYYRVTNAGDQKSSMEGHLALLAPGFYSSTLTMDTPCGPRAVQLEATVVH